jgi:methyl-accepting chemotaxis protein
VIASFPGAHFAYYFLVAGTYFDGPLPSFLKTALVDGSVTLILVFVIGMLAAKFSRQAVDLSREELENNNKQYAFIKNLLRTIEEAYNRLRESIGSMTHIIGSFSENAQSQAASVEEMTATFEEISASADNAASATKEQNASIGEMIASIQKLSKSIENMERYGSEMSVMFERLIDLAKNGERATSLLDESNKKISANSNDIRSVITIIEELFDRINLLSLNASIEAARAGEHGRGFAVVADEVGKLADNSAQKLGEISSLIEKNKSDTARGSAIINDIIEFISTVLRNIDDIRGRSSEALIEIRNQKQLKDDINAKTADVKNKSDLIERVMSEQKNAFRDVQKSIEETNHIVQNNSKNTDILKENSDNLNRLAADLSREFSKMQ